MNRRHLIFLLPTIIACSFLLSIIRSQDAHAWDWWYAYNTCRARSGSGGAIYGHNWACETCANNQSNNLIGAIWLAGGTDNVKKFSNTVSLQGNVTTANVYVFGDVFTCSRWPYQGHNYAVRVKTSRDTSEGGYITLHSSVLYRGMSSIPALTWNYGSLGGASSYISGTIDINRFKQIATCNGNQCSDTVWIHRCFSNNGQNPGHGAGTCNWAESRIVVDFSEATQDIRYPFTGSNRVFIGDEDYTDRVYLPESASTGGAFKYQTSPINHNKTPRWCTVDGTNGCNGPWNSSPYFTIEPRTFTTPLGQSLQFCKTLTYYQTFVERVSTLSGGVVSSWYENPTNITACVTIDHRYNYKASPSANFGNSNIPLYGGDPSLVHVTPTVKNTKDDPNRPATQTEPGTVQVVQLIVPASEGYSQYKVTGTGDENSDATTTQDPCTFYRKLTNECSAIPGSPIYNIVIPKNSTWSGNQLSLTIPDYPAGTKVCVAVGFKPAKSSATDAWRISDATCRTVAKKPHYQVWGGNLYTAGNITTSNTIKRINHVNYLFGSWTEYALIAGGTIQGLSSGATTGYITRYNDQGGKILGDSTDEAFCSRSPLTIANANCSSQGPITGRSGVHYDNSTVDRIISRFAKAPTDPPPTHVTPCTEPRCVSYTSVAGDLTIPNAPTLQKGVTHVIYATGNITINANILASPNNTTFNHISEVPQYLIISNKDIRIAPHVTRVDSWLIAKEGTVNTCYNYLIGSSDPATSLSSSVCNSQLRINGPILTKSITPHRTYGSDQGFSATPPAEIFNLPPTTYFWAYHQSTSHSQAFTTYLKELGPRY